MHHVWGYLVKFFSRVSFFGGWGARKAFTELTRITKNIRLQTQIHLLNFYLGFQKQQTDISDLMKKLYFLQHKYFFQYIEIFANNFGLLGNRPNLYRHRRHWFLPELRIQVF